MKIRYLIISTVFLTLSCSNGTENKSTNTIESKRIEGKNPNDLNSKVSIIDTTLNPFANGLLFSTRVCENEKNDERINCIFSKFPPRPFPMHFGPIPEINLSSEFQLNDSLFIVKALNDTNYFIEEERQYNYYLGVNIPNEYNFKTVVIPEWFSVGKSYTLFTFSDSGNFIDKLVVGSESSDYESIFGKIENLNNIEVTTKMIGYNEESDLLYFSSSQTELYYINEDGKILKK